MVRIRWGGEDLQLLPERAVFWEHRRTLLIADPHFGKAAAFRHAGVPVPAGTTKTDLARLDRLAERLEIRRLVVLGDFLHARTGCSAELMTVLGEWRRSWPDLQILLVRGNHDLRAGDPPAEWAIEVAHEPFADGPFLFCHEPGLRKGGLVIGGHFHPAAVLVGPAGEWLRVPCFCFGPRRAVLPAFGSFTGCKAIRPRAGERIFVVGSEEVVEAAVER